MTSARMLGSVSWVRTAVPLRVLWNDVEQDEIDIYVFPRYGFQNVWTQTRFARRKTEKASTTPQTLGPKRHVRKFFGDI